MNDFVFARPLLLLCLATIVFSTSCDTSDRIARLEKQNQELQERIRSQEAKSAYELSEKCSEESKIWFNANWVSDKDTILLDYSNHYNKKLNKCFILVEYHYKFGSSISWNNDMTLWDVQENVKYGKFAEQHEVNLGERIKSHSDVLSCEIPGKTCKTLQEFNQLVQPFLND